MPSKRLFILQLPQLSSPHKVWEHHPNSDEFILQLSDTLELIFERGGVGEMLLLQPRHFAIVPSGIWHTANVPLIGSALFMTRGEGTEH